MKCNGCTIQPPTSIMMYFRQSEMKLVFAVLFLAVAVSGLSGPNPAPSNVLFCNICVDIVTDIDEFLVSEPTEQAVIEFVAQVRYGTFFLRPE